MLSTTLPFLVTMDTPAAKKAAKKRRLRDKRAATNLPTPATIADTSQPAIIAPNESATTTTIIDNSECPDKEIEDLWRLVARRAAKKAWQRNYVEEQMRLRATATQSTHEDIVPTSLPQPPHHLISNSAPLPQSSELPLTTMDNIWRNAARKARARDKRTATTTATATTPAAAAAVTTFSTATVAATENTATSPELTEEDVNTVEKLDEKLARMEQHWAETQSGPFPEGVRNAIADLRVSLERDTETAPTSETAATPERLDQALDVRHVTPVPARSEVEQTTTTTATDPDATTTDGVITVATAATVKPQHESEETEKEERKGRKPNKEKKETRTMEEESERNAKREGSEIVEMRGVEGVEGVEEEQAVRRVSAKEGGNEEKKETVSKGIEESQDEVRGNPPPPTAHPASVATVREPRRRFDWATETDRSIGPVPNASDFRPTKHPSPLASPEPTPRLLDNPVAPSQPVCMPPKPTATPSNGDVAPSVRTPAMRAPTEPHARTLSIVYGPRDLSALRSGTSNPWDSIKRRHHHSYPPRDLTTLRSDSVNPWGSLHHQRHRSYPLPIYFAQPSSKEGNLHSPAPPVHIIQTIRHPHGISPTKPKITKNIPAFPILSVETQEHTRVSHCACGAILPIRRLDRGSWRLRDPRWRFGRRFSSRFRSRFWDWERGRSHFRGGWME